MIGTGPSPGNPALAKLLLLGFVQVFQAAGAKGKPVQPRLMNGFSCATANSFKNPFSNVLTSFRLMVRHSLTPWLPVYLISATRFFVSCRWKPTFQLCT